MSKRHSDDESITSEDSFNFDTFVGLEDLEPLQDHYSVLGFDSQNKKNISAADIRKAYRGLALQLHPDKHPNDPNAKKNFQAIDEAYKTLGDPAKRRNYDQPVRIKLADFFPHFLGHTILTRMQQNKYISKKNKETKTKGAKVFFAKVASLTASLLFFLPWLIVEGLIASIVSPFKILALVLVPPLRQWYYLKLGRNLKAEPLTTKEKVFFALDIVLGPIILLPLTLLVMPYTLYSIYKKIAFALYFSDPTVEAPSKSTHKNMHAKMKPAKPSKKAKNDKECVLEEVTEKRSLPKVHTNTKSFPIFMRAARVNEEVLMTSAEEPSLSHMGVD